MSNLCRSFREPCPCGRSRFGWQMSNTAKMPETWNPPEKLKPSIFSNKYRGMSNKDRRGYGRQGIVRSDAGQDFPREYKKQELFQEFSDQLSQGYQEYGICGRQQPQWLCWEPCRCCAQQTSRQLQRCCEQQPSRPQRCCEQQPPRRPPRCFCEQQLPPPQAFYEQQPPQLFFEEQPSLPPEICLCDQPPPPQKCFCDQQPPPKRWCCEEQPPPPPKRWCCEEQPPPPPKRWCCEEQPPSPPQTFCCEDQPPPPPKRWCCEEQPPPPPQTFCCEEPPPPPPKRWCCEEPPPPPPKKCSCEQPPPPPPKRCCCEELPPPPRRCCCDQQSQSPPRRCCCEEQPAPKRCCCEEPPPPKKCSCEEPPPPPPKRCCREELPPPPRRCCCDKQSQSPQRRCCCEEQPPPPPKKCSCEEPPKKCSCEEPPPPPRRCCCDEQSQSPQRRCCCEEPPPPPPKKCSCEEPPPPPRCCCDQQSQSPPRRCCCEEKPSPQPRKCCCNCICDCLDIDVCDCRANSRRKKRCCRRKKCCSCESMCVVTHEMSIQTEGEPCPKPEPPAPDRIEIIDITTQEKEVRHRNGEVEILVDEIQTVTVVPNDGSKPTKSHVQSHISSNAEEPQRVHTQFQEEIDPSAIELPEKAVRYSQLEPILANLKESNPPSGYTSPSEVKERRVYRTNEKFEKDNEYKSGKQETQTYFNDSDDDSQSIPFGPSSSPPRRPASRRSPKIRSPSNKEAMPSKKKKTLNKSYSPPVSKYSPEKNIKKVSKKQKAKPTAFKKFKQDSKEQWVNPRPFKKIEHPGGNLMPEQSTIPNSAKPVLFKNFKEDFNKEGKASGMKDSNLIENSEGNLVPKPRQSDFSQLSTIHMKVTNRREQLSQKAGRKSIHQDALFETKISELRLIESESEPEPTPEPTPESTPEPEPEPEPKRKKCTIRNDMKNGYPSNDLVCRRKRKCPSTICGVPCGVPCGLPCGVPCGAGCGAGFGAGRRSFCLPCIDPCSRSLYPSCMSPLCSMQIAPITGCAYYCNRCRECRQKL